MNEFVRKHEDRVHGALSCFDRMLFRGYLPIMSGWSRRHGHDAGAPAAYVDLSPQGTDRQTRGRGGNAVAAADAI